MEIKNIPESRVLAKKYLTLNVSDFDNGEDAVEFYGQLLEMTEIEHLNMCFSRRDDDGCCDGCVFSHLMGETVSPVNMYVLEK